MGLNHANQAKLFLFLIALSSPAYAADLYKCIDDDGIPSYVAKQVAGQACTLISRYTQKDGRWRFITMSAKGSVVSIDMETIQRTPAAVTLWVQSVHDGEKPMISGKGVSYKTLSRERFSCNAMTSETLAYAEYDASGTVLENRAYVTGAGAAPIVPDTVYEPIWREVCKPAQPSKAR